MANKLEKGLLIGGATAIGLYGIKKIVDMFVGAKNDTADETEGTEYEVDGEVTDSDEN